MGLSKQTIVYDFTFDNVVIAVDISLEFEEVKMDILTEVDKMKIY